MATFTEKQIQGDTPEQQPWKGLRQQVTGQPTQVKLPETNEPWVGLKDQVTGSANRFDVSASTAFEREDPDRSARILSVADEVKLPVDFVERNLDRLEKDIQKRGFNPKEYRQKNPVVSEWLAQNPHHFSAAKDDLNILEQAENIVRGIGERGASLAGGAVRSTFTAIDPVVDYLETRMPLGRFQIDTDGVRWVETTQEAIDDPAGGYSGLAESLSDVDLGYEEYTSWDDFKESPLSSFIPYALEQGLISTPDMAAAMLNVPAYVAARTGELGQQRAEADRREDATVKDLIDVLPASIGSAMLERLGAKGILGVGDDVTRLSQIPGRVGVAAGQEAATEFAQESLESTATTLGTEQGFDLAETLESGLAGAVAGGGYGGIGRGVSANIQYGNNYLKARERQRFFEQLGENAENSKLRERVPKKYRELYDKLTKDGPVEFMYVPEEAHKEYWQSQGRDPRQAAEETFGDVSYYDKAKENGGMIKVPTAVYAERVAADNELNSFYTKNSTFDPTEMTMAEIERAQQDADNFELATPETGYATAEQNIYNDLLGQLQLTTSRDVADRQARFMASVFRVLGQRNNIDPFELYKMRNVNVRREVPESLRNNDQRTNLDFIIDAIRDDSLPTEDQVYGPQFIQEMRRQGIVEDGGELSARDVDAGQVANNRMVRSTGQWNLDDAAERAFELGLISENDQAQLFEVIDRELAGERIPIEGQFNENLASIREYAESLMGYLEEIDVDLNDLTNEQVASILSGEAQPSDFQVTDDDVTLDQVDTESANIFKQAGITREDVARNQRELNQAKQEAYENENLLVVHNIKSDGVRFANKLGGLAAPSIAVTDVSKNAFDSFGDISLIADPSLLDSPRMRTFDADVYSPRQPRAVFEINDKAYTKWSKRWGEAGKDIGKDNYPQAHDLEEGPSALVFNDVVAYEFLQSIGRAPKPVKAKVDAPIKKLADMGVSHWNWRDQEEAVKKIVASDARKKIEKVNESDPRRAGLYDDIYFNEDGTIKDNIVKDYAGKADSFAQSGGIDSFETSKKIRRLMSQNTVKAKFNQYVSETFSELEKSAKLFKGFTDSGQRRYSSYTLDNIVRYMTRSLQGGEEFNYTSAGVVRSAVSGELKGSAAAARARNRIVSPAEFEAIKEEAENRLEDALSKLREFYKFDSDGWGYTTDAIQALSEGRKGQAEAFEMNEESRAIIDDLLGFLRDMPTEYFEAKAQRAVQFNEFQVAVVPNGTPQDVINILKDSGLKIKKYNDKQDGARQKAVADAAKKEKVLFQKSRGTIRFGADTGFNREFTITLNDNADLSTFLHESGHLFLETMFDLSEMDNAPQQIKDDVAAALKNMGVKSRDEVGTKEHEMFAEWHEQYLFDGKAPSAEMRGLMATFQAWLERVYKFMRNIGITGTKLNDEVRGIFDRLVATDEEIEAASNETRQLWEAFDESGMTQEEWDSYIAEIEESKQQAQQEVRRQVMTEQARQKKEWYQKERDKVRKEIKAQVDEMQVYRALDVLQRGKSPDGGDRPEGTNPIKLSKQGIVDLRGQGYLKNLPRPYVYTREGGVSPQMFADMMGYSSTDEMLNAIEGAVKKNTYINDLVNEEMRQRYGDMLQDGEIPAAAIDAVHNDRKGDVLQREIKSLGRRAGKRAAPRQLLKAQAERIINQKKVKDIQPNLFRMAENKASRAAFRAAMANDYETAFVEKQKEILNHELFKQARDAREFEERVAKHMRKLGKSSAQERIGKAGSDYLDQINGILDTYEFKRQSNKELQRRESLRSWMREKEQNGETLGEEFDVPDEVIDRSNRINYRELPVQELRGVFDMVQQIEHFARLKNRLMQEKAKRDKDQARNELISALQANIKSKGKPPLTKSSLSKREKFGELARKFDASLLKMEQIVEWLDDGDLNGPWHRLLWDGAIEAQATEQDYTEKVTKRIADAVENIPKETRKNMLNSVGVIGGRRATRKDVIGIALNAGNESNYQKMLKGMNWTPGEVDTLMNQLTKEEWDFVQSVWDTLEDLWPEIAKLEKKVKGVEPARVEARKVQTKFGEYRGGYYPVMYDPNYSEQGELQLSANIGNILEQGYTRATTPKGHTKQRVEGYARPFNFDIDFLTLHTAGVIKDLTHREWLIDANWIVNDPQIKEALNDSMGPEYTKLFNDWVKNIANDRNASNLKTLGVWKRMFEQLRINMMVATMGFKATTMISQIAGLGPSIEVVGGKEGDGLKWMSKATGQIIMNPKAFTETWDMIKEKSSEMKYRLNNKDRDIRSALKNVQGKDDALSTIQRVSLQGIGYADLMVTIPTWMAAYNKAQSQGLSEALSIKAGDRAVRLSQGSGGAKDLASVASRSDTLMRLLTMYYTPFSAMHNRLRNIGHEFGSIRDVPKAFASVWWLAIIPATFGELLVGRGPEDDEEWASWFLNTNLAYLSLGVPFIRDIVSATTSEFGYTFTPIAQVGKKTSNVTRSLEELATGDKPKDEALAKLAKDTFSASGYWLGVPTSQLEITGGYMYDLATGEDDTEDFVQKVMYRRQED